MYLLPRQDAIGFYARNGVQNTGERGRDLRQDVYRLLGLVPPRSDVAQQDVGYLGSLITGFYDENSKAFYLLDDQGGPSSPQGKATVVHELTHALQDQYYDLGKLQAAARGDWDRSRVLASVLEGDALDVEASFFGRPLRQIPACFTLPADRGGAAYAVQRDLDSWYFDGYCFVKAVLAGRPGGITAVFEDLPRTTEQLLHPDRYLAGEDAKPVTLSPLLSALGPDWQTLGSNVFGEYLLQNLLHLGLPADNALVQAAAAGWGGDRWILYGRADGALLLQAGIAWDSPGEAQEFRQALARSLAARSTNAQPADDDGSLRAQIGGVTWRATLTGDFVSLLVSDDADALQRASGAAVQP